MMKTCVFIFFSCLMFVFFNVIFDTCRRHLAHVWRSKMDNACVRRHTFKLLKCLKKAGLKEALRRCHKAEVKRTWNPYEMMMALESCKCTADRCAGLIIRHARIRSSTIRSNEGNVALFPHVSPIKTGLGVKPMWSQRLNPKMDPQILIELNWVINVHRQSNMDCMARFLALTTLATVVEAAWRPLISRSARLGYGKGMKRL